MKKLMALVAALAVAVTLEAVQAQFSYQGVLKDTNGTPLTGFKTIEVRLYNSTSASLSAALWGHKYTVTLDQNGLFNIEVSDNTGTAIINKKLDDVLLNNETVYIGIKMDGSSGEIVPRQKLLPVPFAAVAANVSRASGNFTVTGKLTAGSAAFSGKVDANTLTVSKSISAGSLTSKGNATISGNLAVSGAITGFGIVPVGSIIMWNGAVNEIPTGWALCNGQNGTPDLRNRFVVGAGSSYTVGATGGEATHTLTVAEMPSHTHSYKFKGADLAGAFKKSNFFYCQKNPYDLSNTANTDSKGGGQPHNNLPPYYALCFIMRIN